MFLHRMLEGELAPLKGSAIVLELRQALLVLANQLGNLFPRSLFQVVQTLHLRDESLILLGEQHLLLRQDAFGQLLAFLFQRFATPRDDQVGDGLFQLQNATALQQFFVAADTPQQGLLPTDGDDLCTRDAQPFGGTLRLRFDFFLDLEGVAQFVPKHIDLVEQHELVLIAIALEILFPDDQIALRHPSVDTQQKEQRIGIVEHAEGQLGFRTDGVQTGSVQYGKAGIKNGVRKKQHGVTPAGDQHLAETAGGADGIFATFRDPVEGRTEAQTPSFFNGDTNRFGQHLEALSAFGLVCAVHAHPCAARALQLFNTDIHAAAGNGQKLQSGAALRRAADFDWTHSGLPGAGGQKALTLISEEEGVD